MKNQHPELLPCPFCGGKVQHSDYAIFGCETEGCFAREGTGVDFGGDDEGEDLYAEFKAWNRRVDLYPVFDILERLYREGYYTSEQDGQWWLWRKDGEGIACGRTFRGLCVNIVLAGL